MRRRRRKTFMRRPPTVRLFQRWEQWDLLGEMMILKLGTLPKYGEESEIYIWIQVKMYFFKLFVELQFNI